jgi:phage shock protein E
MRRPSIALMVALSLGAACTKDGAGGTPGTATSGAANEELPDRDPVLARKLVERGALLLDVRTVEEFAARHLDGAHSIPVGELRHRLTEIAQLSGGDKGRAIVVYCRSGQRSARAKRALLQAGYRRVSNLGGIDDWEP